VIENAPEAVGTVADAAIPAVAALVEATGGEPLTEIIAVTIPIVAIVFGVGIGMLSMYFDYRKKRGAIELHHKERLAAIDKGIELPPLPPGLFEDSRRDVRSHNDYLRRGLIWLFVGVAIFIALDAQRERASYFGLIPAAVGVAYLLYYYLAKPSANRDKPA
jgi:hypothetical protein